MPYISREEYISQVLESEELVQYLTDEQIDTIWLDLGIACMKARDGSRMSRLLDEFLHHEWEQTDMQAAYTIEEQTPQRFDGIPQSGKVYERVRELYAEAFYEGIEHAVRWMLADTDYYD